MGISIYYQFQTGEDLLRNGYLQEVERMWDAMFEGVPYESWCWYEPKIEKGLFRKTKYCYEGATQLPMDEEEGPLSVLKSLEVLTELRNKVGGSMWSVSLDDMEIPWDEGSNSYSIEM